MKSAFDIAGELINCIPSNWADPLLTGQNKVLPDGPVYSPQDVERLLTALRARMEEKAHSLLSQGDKTEITPDQSKTD